MPKIEEWLEIDGTGPYITTIPNLQPIEEAGGNLDPYLDFS